MVRDVVDVNGSGYRLSACLGRGAQGAVYGVEGGRLAVKILNDRSPLRREHLRNHLARLRRLDLTDLPLARPLEVLREPHLGYVMELMSGMTPLKELIRPEIGQASLVQWYFSGGGLRRRLRLLTTTADILLRLHSRGLIYSDLSPSNVFISSDISAEQVYLIDLDNLCYQSAPSESNVYTPLYGAPEVILGRSGPNTLTDAYAFAVIAFETLVGAHPLLGDMIHDGEPELEQQALEGRFPWIDSPADARNRSRFGLSRDMVLTKGLQSLFERAFGEGLTAPLKRPGMAEWSERLHRAANGMLRCPGCTGTYDFRKTRCPWCDAPRPRFVTVAFRLWDPSRHEYVSRPAGDTDKRVIVDGAALAAGETLIIGERLALGLQRAFPEKQIVSAVFADDQVTLSASDAAACVLTSPDQRYSQILSRGSVPIKLAPKKPSWQVHFGDLGQIHRIASFELRDEETL